MISCLFCTNLAYFQGIFWPFSLFPSSRKLPENFSNVQPLIFCQFWVHFWSPSNSFFINFDHFLILFCPIANSNWIIVFFFESMRRKFSTCRAYWKGKFSPFELWPRVLFIPLWKHIDLLQIWHDVHFIRDSKIQTIILDAKQESSRRRKMLSKMLELRIQMHLTPQGDRKLSPHQSFFLFSLSELCSIYSELATLSYNSNSNFCRVTFKAF